MELFSNPLTLIAQHYPYDASFFLNEEQQSDFVDELFIVTKTKKDQYCNYDTNYISEVAKSLICDFNIGIAYQYYVTLETMLQFTESENEELDTHNVIVQIKKFGKEISE